MSEDQKPINSPQVNTNVAPEAVSDDCVLESLKTKVRSGLEDMGIVEKDIKLYLKMNAVGWETKTEAQKLQNPVNFLPGDESAKVPRNNPFYLQAIRASQRANRDYILAEKRIKELEAEVERLKIEGKR